MSELEDAIGVLLPSNAGIDGHEFGDGECIIYIYGLDADDIWSAIEAALKKSEFQHIDVTLQCGRPDDPATRDRKFTL